MTVADEALRALEQIPGLTVRRGARLAEWTRFGIGGPCLALAETGEEPAYLAALQAVAGTGWTAIAGGTNLIVSDKGYPGFILRFTGDAMRAEGEEIEAGAGAELNALVDFANARGLAGLEAMAGIPGWVGAAVHGNAGAYGQSIAERIVRVRFTDGPAVREFDAAGCAFHYRESIFKKQKAWQILSARLRLTPGDGAALAARSASIRAARDAKFPPTMRCAGSIFKNLLVRELEPAVAGQVDPAVIREGKIPAGWFLEQVGVKGLRRGGMRVADYHANLVYNTGDGTATDLITLLDEMKRRVLDRYGLRIEEEVQYLGFAGSGTGRPASV